MTTQEVRGGTYVRNSPPRGLIPLGRLVDIIHSLQFKSRNISNLPISNRLRCRTITRLRFIILSNFPNKTLWFIGDFVTMNKVDTLFDVFGDGFFAEDVFTGSEGLEDDVWLSCDWKDDDDGGDVRSGE